MFMWLIDFQFCTKRQARLPMKSDSVFAAPNKQVQKNVEKKMAFRFHFEKKWPNFTVSWELQLRFVGTSSTHSYVKKLETAIIIIQRILNLDLSEFLLVNNLRKSCVNGSNNHLRDRKTQRFISYCNTISDKSQRPFHPKNNRKIIWQKITFSEMSQIFFSPWKFSVALLQRFIFNFTFELGCIALMHQKIFLTSLHYQFLRQF